MDENQEEFLILGMEGFAEDQCWAGIRGEGDSANNHLGDVDGRDGGRRGSVMMLLLHL